MDAPKDRAARGGPALGRFCGALVCLLALAMTELLRADYLPVTGPSPLRFRLPLNTPVWPAFSRPIGSLVPYEASAQETTAVAVDNPQTKHPQTGPGTAGASPTNATSSLSSSAHLTETTATPTNLLALSPEPRVTTDYLLPGTNQTEVSWGMLAQFFTGPPVSTKNQRSSVVLPLSFIPPQPKTAPPSRATLVTE